MKITAVKLSKLCLIIYFLYIFWFVNGVTEMRILLHGMTLLATAFVAYEVFQRGKLLIPAVPFLKMMAVYGAYALVSGVFIAQHMDFMISQLVTFFLVVLVCYDCCYVSRAEGSMEWVGKTVVAAALISAVQVILFPYFDPIEGRASLGPNDNPNVLGVILVAGIFFLIHRRKKMQRHFLMKVAMVLLLLYAIGMTGSRKSLIASALLVVIWIFSYLKDQAGAKMQIRSMLSLLLLIVGILLAIKYLQGVFLESVIFDRLVQMVENHGSASRSNLYQEAFEVWKAHPIFGVGYAQFSFYSSTRHISHSTYMEILSCTGLIGFLITFIPVARMGFRIVQNNCSAARKKYRYDDRMLLAIFLVELFLGIGQEWFYYTINMVTMVYVSWRLNYTAADLHTEASGSIVLTWRKKHE